MERRIDLGSIKVAVAGSNRQRAQLAAQGGHPDYNAISFIKDVNLVWANCAIYNAAGSAIVRMSGASAVTYPYRPAPNRSSFTPHTCTPNPT